MFKNLSLKTKLSLGFGMLILISMIVGGVAVMKMRAVESDSIKLSEEYAPEAKVASDLERRAYRTMYAMRGYTYTGDKKFLDAGMAALAQVKETIGIAGELAAKAIHLPKLKNSLADITKDVSEYEKQAGQTVEKRTNLEKTSADMATTAQKYMTNADAFFKTQTEAMAKEIKEAASAEKLGERLTKITMLNELIDLGNKARITNLQARSQNDFTIMKEGISKIFPEIERTIKELLSITRTEVNRKQLAEIASAAEHYKSDMQHYLTIHDELDQLGTARGATGDHVLELTRNLMHAANDATGKSPTRQRQTLVQRQPRLLLDWL